MKKKKKVFLEWKKKYGILSPRFWIKAPNLEIFTSNQKKKARQKCGPVSGLLPNPSSQRSASFLFIPVGPVSFIHSPWQLLNCCATLWEPTNQPVVKFGWCANETTLLYILLLSHGLCTLKYHTAVNCQDRKTRCKNRTRFVNFWLTQYMISEKW